MYKCRKICNNFNISSTIFRQICNDYNNGMNVIEIAQMLNKNLALNDIDIASYIVDLCILHFLGCTSHSLKIG